MKKLSESVWADIHRRSNGDSYRKEDAEIVEVIKEFIKRHDLKENEYTINSDLSLDVYKTIVLKTEDVLNKIPGEYNKIPFKFGKIDGTMRMYQLNLETLENSPREVTGDFVIYNNKIRNFIGSPEKVGGDFSANMNYNLQSLDGSPKEVGGNYSILGCKYIEDISGISPEIGGNLELTNKPWKVFSDDEFRKYSNIKGNIIRK